MVVVVVVVVMVVAMSSAWYGLYTAFGTLEANENLQYSLNLLLKWPSLTSFGMELAYWSAGRNFTQTPFPFSAKVERPHTHTEFCERNI